MAKNKLQLFMILATALTMLTACSESSTTTESAAAKQGKAHDIDTLMKHAEEATAEAGKLGFEWSVTAPLLEEAHTAYKAGNHEQATALFQEVKHQSKLAIEQAHYANKHWQLLIPVND